MKHSFGIGPLVLVGGLCLTLCVSPGRGAESMTIGNGEITADFDATGLVRVSLAKSGHALSLAGD